MNFFTPPRPVRKRTGNGPFWAVFTLLTLFLCGTGSLQAQAFDQTNLNFNGFAGVNNATSLEFGPDGNLYVVEEDGLVKVYTIQRNGPKDYTVVDAEVLTLVQSIPNHDDDDGALGGPGNRQVTGVTTAGTAADPVIYVSSSDRRRGAGGGGGDANLDTNSGVITRLTKNAGGTWEAVDIVRGLPRSEENHATNGMQFQSIAGNDWLIVASGGFTNAGSPSNNFAFITEYALSGAVLAIDLTAIEALPIQNDGTRDYVYDIPTLDDPTRPNANGITDPNTAGYNGIDINDPWGGNDGLNMGMLVVGSPVKMFSPGYRNTYDLVITEDGHVYVTDNGANGGWGGYPEYEGDPNLVNNNYRPGEPGSNGPDQAPNSQPFDPQVNNSDHLNLVSTDINSYTFGSVYGGHPCPVRANENAGLFTRGSHSSGGFFSDSFFRTQKFDPDGSTPGSETDPQKALPANWPPVDPSLLNPENADFRQPTLTPGQNPDGPDDIIVVNWSNNSNGIAEYTASNFGGIMKGDLVAGKGSALHRVDRDPDTGAIIGFEESKFSVSGNALGVDTRGDGESFPGTIWVANYNGDDIVILEPNDFVICILPGEAGYDPNGDNDSDGYTNDDELQNGTDLCSGASQPSDFDNDLVSDLLDLDDDNDGINDDADALQMGSAVDLPADNEFFLGTDLGGYLGLGLTGLMNNGDPNPNYLDWQDDPFASNTDVDDILGGAIGAVTMYQTTGDASTNDQEKAYQFGINVDNTSGSFTIHGRMFPPFHNFSATESQGMFIGDGFQDDYVKLVMGQNYQLSVVGENNGTPVSYISPTSVGFAPDATTSNFDLYFVVDSGTGSVQARYSIDDGPVLDLGAPFTLEGDVLTSLQSASPLIVGIIGTADADDGFAANWDFLKVAGSVPFVTQALEDLDRFINDPQDVIGLDSYFGDDEGTANLTYTVEANTNTQIGAAINGDNLTLTYPSVEATTEITIRATDSDLFFIEQTFSISVTDEPVPLIRIRANGATITATDAPNPDWISAGGTGAQSGNFNGIPYSVNTGNFSTQNISNLDGSVPAYVPQALFANERWDPATAPEMEWTFSLPNGNYFVRLYMGNGFGGTSAVGQRVFDISIEGALVQDNLDLVDTFGHQVGGMIEYPVALTDGTLNILFEHVVENPLINGIEILGAGGTVINPPITIDPIANQVNDLGDTPVLSVVANGGDPNETFDFVATGLPPGLTIEPTNGSILGTISSDINDATTYPVTVTVDKPSSSSATINFNWTVLDPNATGTALFRVNAGGALTASNDADPKSWDADQATTAANGTAVTGTPSPYVNSADEDQTFGVAVTAGFTNTTGYPDNIFTTERYNTLAVPQNMQWDFPVPNGDYIVNLLFAEVWTGAQTAGVRVFDVEIEGALVLDDLDQTAAYGWETAAVETFNVTVSDSNLDIDFIQGAQNPAIKGIEIIPADPPANLEWADQTDDENYTARHEASFVQAGDKFYLFGGRENSQDLDVYDYQTKTWSTIVNSAPKEFNHFQATEYNGLIWVIGAFQTNAFPNEVPADFVWAYNPATDTWIQGPEIPAGRKRGSAGLVVYNDKFYVIAGNDDGHDGGFVAQFDEFDPATGIWTPLTDTPRARDHFHAEVIGDKLYVAGGRLSGGTGGTFAPLIAEVDVYDFTNGTWSTLPAGQNIPTPRAAAAVGVFQNELYVIGGEIQTDLQGNSVNDAVKTTESFNPSTGVWTTRADLITERHGTQAIVSGGGIHIAAGSASLGGDGTMKNMEYYGTDNPSGTAITAGQLSANASQTIPVGGGAQITLTNTSGNAGVIVTGAQLAGANSGNFQIVSDLAFRFIPPGGTLDVVVSHQGAAQDEVAAITFEYDGGGTLPVNLVSGEVQSTVLYRVNTGGPLTIAADAPNPDWEQDQGAVGTANNSAYLAALSTGTSTFAKTSGSAYPAPIDMSDPSIPAGTPVSIFETERYDGADAPEMLWQFPVTPGSTIEVRLYFAEIFSGITAAGQRVFDVSVEGSVPPVFDDIDQFAQNGAVGAFMLSHTLTVADDILDLEFIHGIENPNIKAIEIIDTGGIPGNLPPVVTNPGPQQSVDGDPVNLQIIASDIDPCTGLTYEATGLPPSLSIDPSTGIITGTLDEGTGSGVPGAFIESDGLVVVEMENISGIGGNWKTAADATSPNIDNPGAATGDDYLLWEGPQYFNQPGNGLLTIPVQISTAGTYRFQWRTQVGNGTNSTEHNDTWLKIEGDAFFGEKPGSIVCPSGLDPNTNDCTGGTPNGSSSGGWFKIFAAGANNWNWSTKTSDNDGHDIFARFDTPGTYNILISARSSSHVIDRMVLSHVTEFTGNPQLLSNPQSSQNVGGSPGASDNSPYNVAVTVSDQCDPAQSTLVEFVWNVTAEPVGNPEALVQVTAGAAIGASTFGNNSFVITNSGDDLITNVTITTTTGYMMDVVFDPVGTAGDNGAKCLTEGSASIGDVGITVPADGGSDAQDCESVFGLPHNGVDNDEGYDQISLDFTDFQPGEAFAFGVDMDPTSIKGDLSTGDAGSISGFEIIGATVSITFASGVTYTSSLFDEGSIGGSDALINQASQALLAPSIAVDGSVLNRVVTEASQTVTITGAPGASVTLLQVDGRLYIDPGQPNVGYDVDLFEANEAMAKVLYTATLDGSGQAQVPVTLLQTTSTNAGPDGGINHFIAVVTAPGGENSPASNTIVLEYDPNAVLGPSALVEITPGGPLGSSTYSNNSFQITNTATGGLQITSVSIDLSTGILPDMVFDPVGAGGDATASCLTPNAGAALTGFTTPADPCVTPFSVPRNGGFDVMTLNFTGFDPGETFEFTTDVDPNSIQGVAGAGNAGAVSGYELIGATVTISFNDGSTLVGSLYEDGSLGGSQVLAEALPTAPSISMLGVGAGPATVNALSQTIQVSGTPGDYISLLQMDSRLFIASGDPPFNVADETYYANEAMSGKSLYSGQIPAGGILDIPVTLLETASPDAGPSGGLNQFVAVSAAEPYAVDLPVSVTSNVVTILYDPNFQPAQATVNYTLQGRTDHTAELTMTLYEDGQTTPLSTYTINGDASGQATVENLAAGTYQVALKQAKYLQRIVTVTLADGANTINMGELLAGDANNDNAVTSLDFSILAGTFNLSTADGGYDDRADFNGDGSVTSLDFSLLAGNFNVAGDSVD